jgi:hypothetical protein
MGDRPRHRNSQDTIDVEAIEDLASRPLPNPGDQIRIRCVVAAEPDQPQRALGIFHDADGEEVAVEHSASALSPDRDGKVGVRATVLRVRASTDGVRVGVSLKRPDGLALEDGRDEIEVSLEQLDSA